MSVLKCKVIKPVTIGGYEYQPGDVLVLGSASAKRYAEFLEVLGETDSAGTLGYLTRTSAGIERG